MKRISLLVLGLLMIVAMAAAQQPAATENKTANVQMEKHKGDTLQAGSEVAFKIKLNAPLPKGAHFIMRISPTAVDQQVQLGSGEPIDENRTQFRLVGKLPEEAVPGKWHISVIYLFLPGTSWTSNTIHPNDLTFDVVGKNFPVPTTAEVNIEK